MRAVTLLLLALLGLVHAELWLSRANGVPRVVELSRELEQQRTQNAAAQAANDRLSAEVRDLRDGLEMIEEKARSELGMVKPDEILVQYARAASAPAVAASAALSATH